MSVYNVHQLNLFLLSQIAVIKMVIGVTLTLRYSYVSISSQVTEPPCQTTQHMTSCIVCGPPIHQYYWRKYVL